MAPAVFGAKYMSGNTLGLDFDNEINIMERKQCQPTHRTVHLQLQQPNGWAVRQ